MITVYVTVFDDSDNDGTFIRVNRKFEDAIALARADSSCDMADYENASYDSVVDNVTGHARIRIINPDTNYEYQAFTIYPQQLL